MTDLFIFGFGFAVCLIVGAALVILVVQTNRAPGATSEASMEREVVRPALVPREDFSDERGA